MMQQTLSLFYSGVLIRWAVPSCTQLLRHSTNLVRHTSSWLLPSTPTTAKRHRATLHLRVSAGLLDICQETIGAACTLHW